MSCIGNSGPLSEAMHAVADDIELASVLSGNRNFEGRISPDVCAELPGVRRPTVVAYAIDRHRGLRSARRMPLARRRRAAPSFLRRHLWPSAEEVRAVLAGAVS